MQPEEKSILDDKNMMVMKLLHYFITKKEYNPIILQGVENEIWLENLSEDYKVVRIVSGYIHNNEQYEFDMFKTKRIMRKIKRKTLSFQMNTLSIFLDLGSSVSMVDNKSIDCISVKEEKDIKKNKLIKEKFPDMSKELKYTEKGLELFAKITGDINQHNQNDATKVEEVFKQKYPVITYMIMAVCFVLYVIPVLFGTYNEMLVNFCIHSPSVRAGQFYRLITGIFLHGDIFHLLFNMYALFVVGTQLESFIGKFKFLLVYLFGGICGSLLSVVFLGNQISIGASGAVFGLMGALIYFGYHYRVYLGNVVRSQLVPLILFNLILGFMSTGIDNASHIGGLVGGALMTITVGLKYKTTTFEKTNGLIISLIYFGFLIYMAFVFTI